MDEQMMCRKCNREIRKFNLAKDPAKQKPIMKWCHWTEELGIVSYSDCPDAEPAMPTFDRKIWQLRIREKG